MFLKEPAGFGSYEAVEVELLDLLSVFLGQSLLFVYHFEVIHDAIKQGVCFESIQGFPPRWTGETCESLLTGLSESCREVLSLRDLVRDVFFTEPMPRDQRRRDAEKEHAYRKKEIGEIADSFERESPHQVRFCVNGRHGGVEIGRTSASVTTPGKHQCGDACNGDAGAKNRGLPDENEEFGHEEMLKVF